MKHTLEEVLKSLRYKKDLRIKGNTIYLLKNQVYSIEKEMVIDNPLQIHDIGNGTWGKLDYLKKIHHYHIVHVNNFEKI